MFYEPRRAEPATRYSTSLVYEARTRLVSLIASSRIFEVHHWQPLAPQEVFQGDVLTGAVQDGPAGSQYHLIKINQSGT